MYLSILVVLIALTVASPWLRRHEFAIACLIGVALLLLAVMRDERVADDYVVYLEIVDNLYRDISDDTGYYTMEPGFAVPLAVSRHYLGLPPSGALQVIVVCFALVALVSKFLAFRLSGVPVLAALLVYYAYFFFLHEMVQMRIGAAIGLLMLGALYLVRGRPGAFFGLVLAASLFHVSSLVFLVAPAARWFGSVRRMTVLTLAVVVGFGALYSVSAVSLTLEQSSVGLFNRALRYFSADNDLEVPYWGTKLLTQLAIAAALYYPVTLLEAHSRFVTFLYRTHLLALMLYGVLFLSPVLAYRVFDVVSCAQPLLLAGCALAFGSRLRPLYYVGLATYAALTFYQIHYKLEIVRPYGFDVIGLSLHP